MADLRLEQLVSRLPFDVIINHIIPYTYQCKDKQLLIDIRSYYNDLQLLENIYFIDFNDTIMINDLVRFCNNNVAPAYGIEGKYERILRRNFNLSQKSKEYIFHFIFSYFHNTLLEDTNRKIKFLWGLLNPKERTRFINRLLFYLEN